MKRIVLFLVTNLAILLVLGTVLRLLGVERIALGEGGEIPYQALLIFAAVFGFGGSFISLAISKPMAKWSTGAQVITNPRSEAERWLVDTVQAQARQAGIGVPEVAIFPSDDPNAFATGMSRNKALVAVSTGLLRNMERREVQAVLGHEIAHVANGDMVTLSLIQGVLNTFVIFLSRIIGYLVDRVLLRGDDDRRGGHGIGFWVTVMASEIFLGILATIIVMWFSRHREFRADEGGAKLTSRADMIAALERLRRAQSPGQLPDSIAAFGIRGGQRSRFSKLFMSHPPLEQRIARLRMGASEAQPMHASRVNH